MDNLLQRAYSIVYERSEEKDRQYGDFIESMARTSRIASELCNKEITIEDTYKIIVALKLSREAHMHKEDNILDCVAYLASLNDYENGKKEI